MIISPVVSDFRESAATLGNRFFNKPARISPELFGQTDFPKRLFSLYATSRPKIFEFLFSGREPNTAKVVFSLLTEPEFSEQTDLTSTAFTIDTKLVSYPVKQLNASEIDEIRDRLNAVFDIDTLIESKSQYDGYTLMIAWAQLAEALRKGHTDSALDLTDSDLFHFCLSHYTSPIVDVALGSIYYKKEGLATLSCVAPLDPKYLLT